MTEENSTQTSKRICYACGTESPGQRTWIINGRQYTYDIWIKNKPTSFLLCSPCNEHIIRREFHKMWQRERRASHPQFYELFEKEKNLIYKRNLDHNPRLKLLLAIGIQCVCTRPNCWHGNQRCIVNDLRCINLDHKLGNGIQDRKRFKRPENMYAYYYKDLDLARRIFQPLCANCNTIKGGTAADYSSISACPISF